MTEPDYFILFKNILLYEIKSVSGPNDYNMKKLESRKEQGFHAFFMHPELTQQEGMSVRQYVSVWLTSTVLKLSCVNNEVFEPCSWELRLEILQIEGVRSFETSESVYTVM